MRLKVSSDDYLIKSGFTVNCTCERSKKTSKIKVTVMVVTITLISDLLGERIYLQYLYIKDGPQAESSDLLKHLIETLFSL